MYRIHDFKCSKCDREWEDLVQPDEQSNCKKCDKPGEQQVKCLGRFGGYSILDDDRKRQMMIKRSADHTLKELKREPEKFGPEGIKRAREGQIRVAGGMAKKG